MVRARTALFAAASLFAAVVGAACSHDWEKLEPVVGGDAAVGGAAGNAGAGGVGGVSGSGGSGGVGGSVDGGGGTGGSLATCSDKTMGRVSGNFGIQFCVDRTEVTNTDYEAFLAANPSVDNQPPGCAWNLDYTPSSNWPPPPGSGARPVAFVDWCDAAAYCTSAGKRLCGGIGGGAVPFGSYAKADTSEWFNACSNGGKQAYPYGDTYSAGACNGIDYGAGGPVTAASASACEGGTKGLFDMSGNVFEWEDSCSDSAGSSDSCRIRGGAFNNNEANLRCDVDATASRNQATVTIGFRCCADAVIN